MNDDVIRLRTINEITAALTKLVEAYKQHIEQGGEHKTYSDAITEISAELTKMVEPLQKELGFLDKARAL